MATTGEGFVKIQFNSTWLNQAVQNTFWYGFAPTQEVTSFADAELKADEIQAEILANDDTRPGVLSYRRPFVGTYNITGVDIWVKGVTGVELAVRPIALNLFGSRVSSGDALPANITASAYAPAQRYNQRGSKIGFSGGLEPDLAATGWVNFDEYFKALCDGLCADMYQSGTWLLNLSGNTLIPCVVPRIRSGTFGIYEYRLPIEAGDVPLTVPIGAWSVGTGTGTANSRKNPVR